MVSFSVSDKWIDDWLSAPRFQKYVEACDGDRSQALQLYEWNISLGQALLRDIAHLEVALRNAYDQVIAGLWQGSSHWLLDPESPAVTPIWRVKTGHNGLKRGTDVNYVNRRAVDKAIYKCGGTSATPGKVIAELSFGFWRSLTTASHEKSVWVPYLHHAYPAGTNRADMDRIIGNINTVRNRIAHHEPLFNQKSNTTPEKIHEGLLLLLSHVGSEVADHVASSSQVQRVLAQRPA